MSSTGNPAGMPNNGQPFVGDGNIITRPWFLFLQKIFDRQGGASGNILGTTTNNDAPPGVIGEYQFADVPIGSAMALTSGVNIDMAALPLSAGDWDVTLQALFLNTAADTTLYTASLSLMSVTLDLTLGRLSQLPLVLAANSSGVALSVPEVRFSLAAPAVIHAVQNATFSAGTVGAFGRISARRPR